MKRTIVLLSAGFVLVVLLARIGLRVTQDDADLRAFLLPPEGCAMPCWLGIQPGVTTPDQAIAILEAYPWIERVLTGRSAPSPRIFWQWSDQAPDFVDNVVSGIPASYLYAQDNVIRYIRIETRLPYGEVRSLIGEPSNGTFVVSNPNSEGSKYRHSAGYFGGLVVFDTQVSCPFNPAAFWNAPVVITYSDGRYPSLLSMPAYDLSQWVYQAPCTT